MPGHVERNTFQSRFNQVFRLRAGNQDIGSDLQDKSIELAFSGNILDRLKLLSARDQLPIAMALIGRQLPIRIGDKFSPIHLRNM